jgi:hypothetical protein
MFPFSSRKELEHLPGLSSPDPGYGFFNNLMELISSMDDDRVYGQLFEI